jgi:ER membrane protein complex subunit 4
MASPNSPNAKAVQLTDEEITRRRVISRLNDLRLQPLKQLPMTGFMMWMVGNDVSIFSIMFVGMAVVNPLQAIFGASKVFEDFEEDAKVDRQIRSAVNQSKWIYIGCCIVAFLVALVKLNWMELLPVSAMDWMDNTPPTYGEFSTGAFYN